MTTFSSSANDTPPITPNNGSNGLGTDGGDDDDVPPTVRVRDLIKKGSEATVSFVRNAPALARHVWQFHRPWLWMALAFFLMALPTLRRAFSTWTAPASPLVFQPFVPLAVALLLWSRRAQIAQQYRELVFLYGANSPKLRGNLWLAGLGCVLLLLSTLTMIIPLGLFAIFLLFIGVTYYLYGPFVLRPLLLPLSYLILLTPPPGSILGIATGLLRYGSLLVAGQLLRFLFKDAQMLGAYIVFPAFVLQISEGASGITLLLPLLAFALWLCILRRIVIGSSLVLLIITTALVAFMTVARLFFTGVVGALSPEAGNLLQSEAALWFSSLLLGLAGAYLVYKIAVLLSPPRLI